MVRYLFSCALALACAAPALAQDEAEERPADADPLTATIHVEDVERFAALFEASDGTPDAAQLQRDYIDPGSFGVRVFTPYRIKSGENLASAVAEDPAAYRQALDRCLPLVRDANADLRSIYLGLRGALPEARLPQVYIVMGAGNSGGTAAPGAQVLGLEVLCAIAPTDEAFTARLRQFFAHETVHSLQGDFDTERAENILLRSVLAEGAADFIATLVTGADPNPDRSAWAAPREAELRDRLAADLALFDRASSDPSLEKEASAAVRRWVGNYGSPPEGWPSELGYWMGFRLWQAYYDASPDKHAALLAMLKQDNPKEVLAASGFVF